MRAVNFEIFAIVMHSGELGLGGQLESGDMGSSLMADSSISISEQMSGEELPSRAVDGVRQLLGSKTVLTAAA